MGQCKEIAVALGKNSDVLASANKNAVLNNLGPEYHGNLFYPKFVSCVWTLIDFNVIFQNAILLYLQYGAFQGSNKS